MISSAFYGLEKNKVYDIIRYIPSDYIHNDTLVIIDDFGGERSFYSMGIGRIFEDFTVEYRSGVIDEILL